MITKKTKKVKTLINDWKRKLSILAFAFLIIVLLDANIKIFKEKNKSQKELEKIEKAIEAETKEKDRYNFELGKTDSSEYLEKIAREELGLQKPGEQVIIIKKQEELKEEKEESQNFFQKAFNWFKNLLPE